MSLTDDQKDQVRKIIVTELTDKKHRNFQQLWNKVARELGLPQDNESPAYRATDNALQALRRRGVIEWFRFGTYKMWKLTETK